MWQLLNQTMNIYILMFGEVIPKGVYTWGLCLLRCYSVVPHFLDVKEECFPGIVKSCQGLEWPRSTNKCSVPTVASWHFLVGRLEVALVKDDRSRPLSIRTRRAVLFFQPGCSRLLELLELLERVKYSQMTIRLDAWRCVPCSSGAVTSCLISCRCGRS